MISTLIDQLALLAKQNAAAEGWSPAAALEQHQKELQEEMSAKNLADVLWLEAVVLGVSGNFVTTVVHDSFTLFDGAWDEGLGHYENLEPGVESRLKELINRLETTGSLLRRALPAEPPA